MRKYLTAAIVAGAMVIAGSANAADNVVATDHNLANSSNIDDVCVFCHAPHTPTGAIATETPLWNRTTNDTGYTMYSSPTLDMTIAGAPQGVSLACLSCHDGVIGFDQLLSGPTPTMTGDTVMTGGAVIGKDLTGDHPISVTYDPAAEPNGFNAATSVVAAGLELFGSGGDQVECSTCHDPHEADNGDFLRISNTASAICTTCHIK